MNAAATHANCLRCGRTLRSATSIADGYGRRCKTLVRAAARAQVIAQHKPTTVAKATELIEQRALVPLRGRRIFQVVASDGIGTYKTAAQGCTCPAGIKGRYVCYHRVAAQILTAA